MFYYTLALLAEFLMPQLGATMFMLLTFLHFVQQPSVEGIAQSLATELPRTMQAVYWEDTHGGFFGDGVTYAELESGPGEFDPAAAGWQPLPLSDEMRTILYGSTGTVNGILVSRGPCTPEGIVIPEVTNGYWLLIDWQTADGKSIFDETRYSLNFTAALYDEDSGIIYYLSVDT